jgi:hypothetical protein
VENEWTTGPTDENGMTENKRIEDEGVVYNDTYEVEEGEWIPDLEDENLIADGSTIDEGIATLLTCLNCHLKDCV